MPNSVKVASALLNYQFLLITHMICADQQIHSREANSLRDLAYQAAIDQQTLDEMEKILSQEQHTSLEAVVQSVPRNQRGESIQQLLAIAYVDGFCSPLEREMIEQISNCWGVPAETIQKLLVRAETVSGQVDNSPEQQQSLSFGARLLKGADTLLSQALVSKLTEIAPQNMGRKIEQIRHEILLSGPEYDKAIQQCATVANEDYKFAEIALTGTSTALQNLSKGIQETVNIIEKKTIGNTKNTSAKEVTEQLKETQQSLTSKIVIELEKVRESLRAKQRSLNHFSIAFMGKTKAGKSTLHAVITGEGWEAIGVGKQRTTRYNRVYEWKNIRIIDTPGIGAPDGKTDEEIAESIIEESDVICYVVTNDSIQEKELSFLKVLKDKTKPLVILINPKNNLREPKRLENFLKSPDKLFAIEGQSGLGGHIERIRRYARKYYANDYFSIIPVMLLAAQISRETEDQKRKEELFDASRLQDFLDAIRVSLIQHGRIRRSQTLLGSTVGSIESPLGWITQQAQAYEQLSNTLKNKREVFQKDIQRSESDALDVLQQLIETDFQSALNAVQAFAEDHWDANEIKMKLGWEQKLKLIKFEELLTAAQQEAIQKFTQEVQQVLEEIGSDLQLIPQLRNTGFKFTEQDSHPFNRDFIQIGGMLIAAVAGILPLFGIPLIIGGALVAVGAIASLLTGHFKSRDQKRREAVQTISESLMKQLTQQRQITLQQAEDTFRKYCRSVAFNIDEYFDELIGGLDAIAQELEQAKRKLSDSKNYLNRAYAKRIVDWCCDQSEPLTEQSISKSIVRVSRNFGRTMKIYTKASIPSQKSQDEMREVLQELVSIQTVK